MAHLLSSGGSLCQICGKNPKTKKIHDKEKIIWIHDDARVLEVVNRGLKIGRSSTSATGALGAVGVAGGRMAYKGKIGKRTGGMCFLNFIALVAPWHFTVILHFNFACSNFLTTPCSKLYSIHVYRH